MPLPALKAYWQTTDRRTLRFYYGDALAVASKLPTGSVHCMVTSPPYWGLRDYGTGTWEGGNNHECNHTPDNEWIERRFFNHSTLRKDGGRNRDGGLHTSQLDSARAVWMKESGGKCRNCGARRVDQQLGSEPTVQEYVDKLVAIFRELRRVLRDDGTAFLNLGDTYIGDGNIAGVPWRVAFALQEDGWVLRQDIIYSKPSPMPESVTNRCTKAHEYIFLLTKGRDYFYDAEAIKEAATQAPQKRNTELTYGRRGVPGRADNNGLIEPRDQFAIDSDGTRNKRSVWTVSHGGGYQGAHFATYPPALIEPCILAGTSEHGCCPRCGASWERVVGKARTTTRPGKDTKVRPGGGVRLDGEVTGNRDPERHVTDTRTLGWRPGCKCYGLELIGDPPPEPNKGPKETEADFQARHASWRAKQTEWESQWKALKPAYDRAWDPDDDGEGEGAVPCVVLDPFLGSGTTALVCLDKGRACWGIDLSKEYLDQHAIERCRGNLLSRPLLAKLAGPRPQGVPTP